MSAREAKIPANCLTDREASLADSIRRRLSKEMASATKSRPKHTTFTSPFSSSSLPNLFSGKKYRRTPSCAANAMASLNSADPSSAAASHPPRSFGTIPNLFFDGGSKAARASTSDNAVRTFCQRVGDAPSAATASTASFNLRAVAVREAAARSPAASREIRRRKLSRSERRFWFGCETTFHRPSGTAKFACPLRSI